MKWIDITREMIGAPCYPGDPAPRLEPISRLSDGDSCNLSAISACLHNGTHIDAPLHFLPEGEDAAQMALDNCIGECSVLALSGELTGAQLEGRLPFCRPRVLFKGEVSLTQSAAFVLIQAGVKLVGVEGTTVARERTAEIHRLLLGAGVCLLEGLDLSRAEPGTYMLIAAPLKIAGADGSPVRAVLLERQPSLNV